MLKKIFFRWIICIAFFSVIIIGCTNQARETPTAVPVSHIDSRGISTETTQPGEIVQPTEPPPTQTGFWAACHGPRSSIWHQSRDSCCC